MKSIDEMFLIYKCPNSKHHELFLSLCVQVSISILGCANNIFQIIYTPNFPFE